MPNPTPLKTHAIWPIGSTDLDAKDPRADLPIRAGHSFNVVADLGLADADKLFVACAIRSKVFWNG